MKHTFRKKLVIAVSFFSTLLMLFASSPLVAALSPQERWHYANLGIEFIDDPCAPAGDGTGNADDNGSGNSSDVTKYPHIKAAFIHFMKQGYTAEQSAGIVGNLMQESGWTINPRASDGVAHGIAQWQGGRLQPMWTWVAAYSASPKGQLDEDGDGEKDGKDGKDSFVGQLHYLIYDLDGAHSFVKKRIKAMNNEVDVANAWNRFYEVSADTSSKRGDNASKVLAAANANGWANGIVVNPDDPNAPASDGQQDGDCVLPDDSVGTATGKTCKDIGKKSDDSDPKDPYRCNSSELKCTAGNDVGVGAAYANGYPYKIRLCNVGGVVVNAFISGPIDAMMKAAKADGIKLTGGGFRVMQTQINLRRTNGCPADHLGSKDANGFYDHATLVANKNATAPTSRCGTATAPPGFSNHQMGLAVDWSSNGSLIGSHGNSGFKWLDAHAQSYGFYNFPVEPWHWSVDGA